MAKTRDTVQELPAQDVGFLFGTMFDLTTLPKELKHTGKVAKGEFKIVAHFPAIHAKNGTEAAYLARHRTFRGGLYATYQDGPYKIDEVNWDATNRAGVHMVTMTKYGQVVEFPSQPSKTMPGSLKLMVQELVESLKTPGFIIRCSGLGGALEPKKGTTDEYNVILLNGDVKCPKKLANHVPAKYHAEDESIFLAQTGPWCGNAEDYQKPPWIKGPGRKTRAMRSAKKQKNIELREKRNAEQMTQMGDSLFPVIPNTGGGDSALGSGRGVPQWYGAEEYKHCDGCEEVRGVDEFSLSNDSKQTLTEGEVCDYCFGDFYEAESYGAFVKGDGTVIMVISDKSVEGKEQEAIDWGLNHFGKQYPDVKFVKYGAEAYGAESAFDKLANKVAQGYIKKGKSKEEALEIGRKTAYKIGVKKYGKAGMKRKSMEGRMRRKNAEDATETFYLVTFDVRDGDSQYYPQTIYPASVKDMSDEELITKEFGEAEDDGNDYYWVGNTLVSVYNKKPMDLKTKELFEEYGLGAEEFEAPMPNYPPSKGDVDRVQKAIRSRHQGIRFKGSPTYLTERKGGSNKYHVFQMTNRGGFNGYGRIGHTMSLFGPMSQQQYQSKLQSKMRKGYRETGF